MARRQNVMNAKVEKDEEDLLNRSVAGLAVGVITAFASWLIHSVNFIVVSSL